MGSSWSVTTSLAPPKGFVADGRNSYKAGGTVVTPKPGTIYDQARGWIQHPQQPTTPVATTPSNTGIAGTTVSGTITPNTGGQQNDYSKYISQADPFSKYRDQYASQLNTLMSDPSKIANTGAYQWAFNQGQGALERSQAAKGMNLSGNALAELQQYGQGMAGQQFNQYANLLGGLAGANQTPASGFAAATGAINAGTNAFSALNDANYKSGILGIAQQNATNEDFQNNLKNQMLQYGFNQQKNNDSYVNPTQGWGVY